MHEIMTDRIGYDCDYGYGDVVVVAVVVGASLLGETYQRSGGYAVGESCRVDGN